MRSDTTRNRNPLSLFGWAVKVRQLKTAPAVKVFHSMPQGSSHFYSNCSSHTRCTGFRLNVPRLSPAVQYDPLRSEKSCVVSHTNSKLHGTCVSKSVPISRSASSRQSLNCAPYICELLSFDSQPRGGQRGISSFEQIPFYDSQHNKRDHQPAHTPYDSSSTGGFGNRF